MKTIVIYLVSFLFMLVAYAGESLNNKQPKTEQGIEFFEGSWAEALELATKENKLVFLDIYASWCGPCKRLKSNTFSDIHVGNLYNDSFINVAIDGEKGEGPLLARKYGVRAYPSLIFVDQNGKLITATKGYHNAQQFLQLGQEVLRKK